MTNNYYHDYHNVLIIMQTPEIIIAYAPEYRFLVVPGAKQLAALCLAPSASPSRTKFDRLRIMFSECISMPSGLTCRLCQPEGMNLDVGVARLLQIANNRVDGALLRLLLRLGFLIGIRAFCRQDTCVVA